MTVIACRMTRTSARPTKPAERDKEIARMQSCGSLTRNGTGTSLRCGPQRNVAEGTPRLVYEVIYSGIKPDQTPTEMHYIVDAVDQRILESWDTVHTACAGGTSAAGTGRALYAGSVAL